MIQVENEPLLTIEEVASRLKVPVDKLRKKVHLCEVCPAINRRGRMLFWLSQVAAELKLNNYLKEESNGNEQRN